MSATCLPSHHSSLADLAILGLLSSKNTGPFDLNSILSTSFLPSNTQRYRRPQLDPLILETAALSSPLQTRNHYLHEYFPHSQHHHHHHHGADKQSAIVSTSTSTSTDNPATTCLHSDADADPSDRPSSPPPPASAPTPAPDSEDVDMKAVEEVPDPTGRQPEDATLQTALAGLRASLAGPPPPSLAPSGMPVAVQCEARTRIPGGSGAVWLHLYTNTADGKEHLAFVVDGGGPGAIWSRSLDAPRGPGETALDRAVRGASVARRLAADADAPGAEAPVVRIHSECFTGETLGSRRCDCGEQLRRALVHIARTPPFKGCVIYLRQEGRGIGLLNKLKAYNLQDLGFDTFEANLLLGFPPDARDYLVAVKVLEDLGLGRVRLMTNNPEKVEALERCGGTVEVVERIPMVPSHWQTADHLTRPEGETNGQGGEKENEGAELDRYLRTKVSRMRHLIPVPPTLLESSSSSSSSPSSCLTSLISSLTTK